MFNTSVDSILATFSKTIAKLEAHAEQKQAERDNHNIAADKARFAATEAAKEQERALKAAEKLRAFTS